jgi:hypothetical protein
MDTYDRWAQRILMLMWIVAIALYIAERLR